MQLYTELQYDNVSERFALSLRYRWEYQPGQEFFASSASPRSSRGRSSWRDRRKP